MARSAFLARRFVCRLEALAGCASPNGGSSLATMAATEPLQTFTETYRTIDGRPLKMHIFMPAWRSATSIAAAVSQFHGGGWTAGS